MKSIKKSNNHLLLILLLLVLVFIGLIYYMNVYDGFTRNTMRFETPVVVQNNVADNNFNIIVNLKNTLTISPSLLTQLNTLKGKKARKGNSLIINKQVDQISVTNTCTANCPELFFETKNKKTKVTGLYSVNDADMSIFSKLNSRIF
jgi:hypothetical protein